MQCKKTIQLKRLHDRGLTKAQSNARIKSQMSLNKKIRLADIVLLEIFLFCSLNSKLNISMRTTLELIRIHSSHAP